MNNQEFVNFLERNEIKLFTDMIYHVENGIRFNIGDPFIIDDKIYTQSAYKFSKLIFEEIFKDDSLIYLVIDRIIYKKEDESESIYNFIDDYVNVAIQREKIRHYYIEKEEFYFFRSYIMCNIYEIKYKKLLMGLVNKDSGSKLSIDEYIYFINIKDKIVYHLYDDRGLDIAGNKEILKDIYNKYRKWIIEYKTN